MYFEGRIVQHVLCDKILRPTFEPRLVKENAACRQNKGTDFAIKLFRNHITRYLKHHQDGIIIEIDIHKFFPSINRNVLKKLLKPLFSPNILSLIFFIIDSGPGCRGIPIGNQASQWFALFYLNQADRLIKEHFSIKYYVRYMDDLRIIVESKQVATQILSALFDLIQENLDLIVNPKTQYKPLHRGTDFLGWRYFYTPTNQIIQRIANNKRKFRVHKIHEIKYLYKTNKITMTDYNDRIIAVRNNLNHGNTYKFQQLYI